MKSRIQYLLASLLVVPAVTCASEIEQGEMAAYLFGKMNQPDKATAWKKRLAALTEESK